MQIGEVAVGAEDRGKAAGDAQPAIRRRRHGSQGVAILRGSAAAAPRLWAALIRARSCPPARREEQKRGGDENAGGGGQVEPTEPGRIAAEAQVLAQVVQGTGGNRAARCADFNSSALAATNRQVRWASWGGGVALASPLERADQLAKQCQLPPQVLIAGKLFSQVLLLVVFQRPRR